MEEKRDGKNYTELMNNNKIIIFKNYSCCKLSLSVGQKFKRKKISVRKNGLLKEGGKEPHLKQNFVTAEAL